MLSNFGFRVSQRPDWLGKYGLEKWDEIVSRLGEIPAEQVDAVCAYCRAWQMLRSSSDVIDREGMTCVGEKGGEYQRPEVAVHQQSLTALQQLGKRVGWVDGPMSPLSSSVVATRKRN